jgi:hypothetical protein
VIGNLLSEKRSTESDSFRIDANRARHPMGPPKLLRGRWTRVASQFLELRHSLEAIRSGMSA